MNGFTKLFSSILASTVWREPDHVRLVWITMLAMKGRDQVVEASLPGLADFARVSVEKCVEALEILKAPDPYSRTKDHEGRRIREVEGGWEVLNGEKYRDKMSCDERREANRVYQQRHRDRKKKRKGPIVGEMEYVRAVEAGASERELEGIVEGNLGVEGQDHDG